MDIHTRICSYTRRNRATRCCGFAALAFPTDNLEPPMRRFHWVQLVFSVANITKAINTYKVHGYRILCNVAWEENTRDDGRVT